MTPARPSPISRFLADDHARLEALLRRAFAAPGAVDREAYEAFRVGLLRHIAMEEKVLLPGARRARGGAPLPIVGRLRLDHAALSALLVLPPAPEIAAQIQAILLEHDAFEEGPDGFYATCEALAGPDAGEWLERLAAVREPPVSAPVDSPRVRAHVARRLADRAGVKRSG